jgi:rubrerythrin
MSKKMEALHLSIQINNANTLTTPIIEDGYAIATQFLKCRVCGYIFENNK